MNTSTKIMSKLFLVGGAVRDELLNYPFKERDWLLVGATPEELTQQGYQAVGKDFPVFLHPKTKEEYALARKERKSGHGYSGFDFITDPSVTLEEDLLRRDLTINAIAKSINGDIHDPFNGRRDLAQKVLRHVSPAFAEDPVRVLRVARFAARYRHLGFTIAAETKTLMSAMVAQGEVNYLVAERVWKETSSALQERSPHIYFQTLKDCGALAVVFPELNKLFGIEMLTEIGDRFDVGQLSLLNLQYAAALSRSGAVRFAALLPFLGMASSEVVSPPNHRGHKTFGIPALHNLCSRAKVPKDYSDLAELSMTCREGIRDFVQTDAATALQLFKSCDAFRKPDRFHDTLITAKACEFAQGEPGSFLQANIALAALKICEGIKAKDFLAQGLTGKALGAKIDEKRIEKIETLLRSLRESIR